MRDHETRMGSLLALMGPEWTTCIYTRGAEKDKSMEYWCTI